MLDDQLRQLERVWQETKDDADLETLNRARIRAGIPAIRIPGFSLSWMRQIADRLTITARSKTRCAGKISFQGIEFVVSLEKIGRGLTLTLAPVIESEVRENTFLDCRITAEIIEYSRGKGPSRDLPNRPRPNTFRATPITIKRPGQEAINLWENNEFTENIFVNGSEMLDAILEAGYYCIQHALGVFKQHAIGILSSSMEDYRKASLMSEYLKILKSLRRDPFKKANELLEKLLQQNWFNEQLVKLSQSVEKYFVRQHNIGYDFEQTWPVTISHNGDHYYIYISTGYNDEINRSISDESDPTGIGRGPTSENEQEFGQILDAYDTYAYETSRLGGPPRASWSVESEIEEYNTRSGEMAINLKAERRLTINYLLHILQI